MSGASLLVRSTWWVVDRAQAFAPPGPADDALVAVDLVHHPVDVARGERDADDVAHLGVARRIGHDERQHRLQLREVIDEHALGGAEDLRIAGNFLNVAVFDNRPESLGIVETGIECLGRVVPADRPVRPKPRKGPMMFGAR